MRVAPPVLDRALARGFAALCLVLILAPSPAPAARSEQLAADLDKLAEPEAMPGSKLWLSVLARLELRPGRSAKLLLPRLEDDTLSEEQLVITLWALSVTKDSRAVEPVLGLYRRSDSEMVQGMCLATLAEIAGKKAAPHLLTALRAESDPDMRFGILLLLAKIRCTEALPHMGEILEKDSPGYPWQSYFLFGQMGDKAVPFLLARIAHPDPIVRANAILILGGWLAAPEAEEPLRRRYAAEPDVRVREAIVWSLGRMVGDWSETRAFLKKVAAEAEHEELVEVAGEALSEMDALHEDLTELTRMKRVSAEAFQSEYGRAFDKAEVTYERYWDLRISSSPEDERALKKLRAQVLLRHSDECFEDFRRTTDIIIQNRLLAQPPWLYWEPWGEFAAERLRPPGTEEGGFGLPGEPERRP